ncbi:hypothetical protein IWW50_006528 [Coemansia erecta]|nr:hypothetical protein GGF43_006908 [Coemansia sp. RSA 2618]KAJ2816355.1 hypothetical protein IWW50_006528 [Coemansia erecta]
MVSQLSDFGDPKLHEQLKYFTYKPVNIAPEVALGVYTIVGLILVWQMVRFKSQRWVGILPGTAFAEALGYVFRTLCVYNTTFTMYVLMTLFLLVPVNALALANYKAVGKIMRNSNATPRRFWLKPAFVNWFYFASDLFSIAMQGAGGGMLVNANTKNVGRALVMIGLIVQLFFFACYLATTIYVWRRPVYTVDLGVNDTSHAQAKNRVMRCVTITTVILYLRSIYRIAEFADGYGGKIYSCEWAFYVFDTILIFLAFVVYIVLFVGKNFTRGPKMERAPSVAGSVQMPQPQFGFNQNQMPGSEQYLVNKEHV